MNMDFFETQWFISHETVTTENMKITTTIEYDLSVVHQAHLRMADRQELHIHFCVKINKTNYFVQIYNKKITNAS